MVSEKREVRPRKEWRAQHHELARTRVDATFGILRQREFEFVAGDIADHLHHGFVVAIHHPSRFGVGVSEKTCLVRIVFLGRRIAVEVIGTQVRHHSDDGLETWRVMQLE